VYRVLVGNPEGKRPLGRPRRRWEDGIKMGLRETGWGGVEWIHLAQGRDRWRAVVSAVMNLRVLAPRSYLVANFFHSHFRFESHFSKLIQFNAHSRHLEKSDFCFQY
jgi:hypothetical protein